MALFINCILKICQGYGQNHELAFWDPAYYAYMIVIPFFIDICHSVLLIPHDMEIFVYLFTVANDSRVSGSRCGNRTGMNDSSVVRSSKVNTKRGHTSFAPSDFQFTAPSQLTAFEFRPLTPNSRAMFFKPPSADSDKKTASIRLFLP